MKKFLSTALIVVVCTALFTACGKPHTIMITDPNSGSMSATANGQAINSTFCVGTPGSPVSIIAASFANNTDITFNLKTSSLTATTYTLDSSGADNNAEYSIGNVVVLSKSGTLTITSVNPGVSYTGSFNFTCVDGTALAGTFTATEVK